jgi:hypothetical protein
MLRWLQVLVLIGAMVAGAFAVKAHRLSAGSGATRWGTRASLLLSGAIFVGTAPAVFFPTAAWLGWSGLLLSLLLMGASMALLRRQRRALRSWTASIGR